MKKSIQIRIDLGIILISLGLLSFFLVIKNGNYMGFSPGIAYLLSAVIAITIGILLFFSIFSAAGTILTLVGFVLVFIPFAGVKGRLPIGIVIIGVLYSLIEGIIKLIKFIKNKK
jgi:hypothetical protein